METPVFCFARITFDRQSPGLNFINTGLHVFIYEKVGWLTRVSDHGIGEVKSFEYEPRHGASQFIFFVVSDFSGILTVNILVSEL